MNQSICVDCEHVMKLRMNVRVLLQGPGVPGGQSVGQQSGEGLACKLCAIPLNAIEITECSDFKQREEPLALSKPAAAMAAN